MTRKGPYSPEFRARVVEMARADPRPLRLVAEDLGVTPSTLHWWVNQTKADDAKSSGTYLTDPGAPLPDSILDRDERMALAYAAAGISDYDAAAALEISDRTLRRRHASAVQALGARNLTNAVAMAVSLGLVELDGVASPASRYRDGDRDPAAVAARLRETRRERMRRNPLNDAGKRKRVTAAVWDGASVAAAAKAEGIAAASVWGYAVYDEEFRAELDEATTEHRTCTPFSRGRPGGYRNGCRCPECRAAHSEETGRYR